jgi:CheY-like chemotaxis protein
VSRTVLIVEDDQALREVLSMALEGEGYEVVLSRDGREALNWLDHGRPALIVLDWRMPRMDGLEFASVLQERGLRPSIPLLVLSADRAAIQSSTCIGADSSLAKPFDLCLLLDEVARLTAAARHSLAAHLA